MSSRKVTTGRKARQGDRKVPRLIIFILGGITYSECRVAYEVAAENSNKCDIIVGGSKMLTPNDFINDLKNMNKKVDLKGQVSSAISEQIPLLGGDSGRSATLSSDTRNPFVSACERFCDESEKIIYDISGACVAALCGKLQH